MIVDGVDPAGRHGHARALELQVLGQVGHAERELAGEAVVSAGPAAFHAHVAGEARQHAAAERRALAACMALWAPALDERRGLRGGVLAGDAADGVSRNLADDLGPFRRLRRAVGRAFQVRAVGLVRLHALWHVRLVEADDERIEELLVVQALLHDDVGHGVHERVVGGGQEGNPLVGQLDGGVGVARVDDDELAAVLLHLAVVVVRQAEDGLGRVVAPEDHELRALEAGQTAAGVRDAEHGRRGGARVAHGHRVVAADVAAGHIAEARGQIGTHDVAARVARADLHVARKRAVLAQDALVLADDVVDGLVPADLLELALATFAGALRGMLQTVGMVLPFAVRAAAHAGLAARGLLVGLERVARVDLRDGAVLDVRLDEALAAAVERRARVHHLRAVVGGLGGTVFLGLFLALGRTAAEHERARAHGAGKRQERPT